MASEFPLQTYHLGLDVGSTTVKTAVLDPLTRQLVFSRYVRHNAQQAATVRELLAEVRERFGASPMRVAVCGSGGSGIALAIGAFFIQEVVANAIAVREYHSNARVAIELGGQDAKVIFFERDEATGRLSAADLRMNGSCAGGTGAFIDQMAELLGLTSEAFGQLAEKGETVHPISGRCGVFAKTDIQPLLNQGVPPADIALSCFHAIAKQTIGGLAQGAEIHPPVIFEGGPLTFNSRLVDVFAERLALEPEQVIIPDHPEVIVACGAAMAADPLYAGRDEALDLDAAIETLRDWTPPEERTFDMRRFFDTEAEREAFHERHRLPEWESATFAPGTVVEAYLGLDAGSTTSKLVVIDAAGNLIDSFYSNNGGDPLVIIKFALAAMRDRFADQDVTLDIRGVGTTGYGEMLFAKAFKADFHTVETVAHAEAALRFAPEATFILDIGGQDMKAISIKGSIVTGIVLNEACSAGCGSFLETYARSLAVPVADISRMAFESDSPSKLGSRCTVFMNSSVVTEQRNGKTPNDIMAGLCRSIVENIFTKVVRVSNFEQLGETLLVQGGTFKNDAVLRALEQYTGRNVIRSPYPGEMGALGIALLTKKHVEEQEKRGDRHQSTFIGLEGIELLEATKKPTNACQFCSNHCSRTVVEFGTGDHYVTGNRCERGEVLGSAKDEGVATKLKEITSRMDAVPDLFKVRNRLMFKDYQPRILAEKRGIRIGIPQVLEFWNSMPFWKAFFTSLGYEVVVSAKSSYPLFESGLAHVPSDTVCFPAKLVHGHVQDLIKRKVDRIFMPIMSAVKVREQDDAITVNMCAVVQGYPLVIAQNDEPERRFGVPLDTPSFHWHNGHLRGKQLLRFFKETYGLDRKILEGAIAEGDRALSEFRAALNQSGRDVLASLEGTPDFAVVLAGRPYHHDELVAHGIASIFTSLGVPVLTLDALDDLAGKDLEGVRTDQVNPFHAQLFTASKFAAAHPNLQVAQIVSFGCGHDAVNTDEMARILDLAGDKQLLILKVDEGEALGPLKIRIKSFIETIRMKHATPDYEPVSRSLGEAFEVRFEKADKDRLTILIPNLTEAFSAIATGVLGSHGYDVEPLPLADDRAKSLGKRYVHNDICYPAQINVGEFLAVMETGKYDPSKVAFGVAKNCDDCRAGQYAILARKALDEAGYPQVPLVTTGSDRSGLHPGFDLGTWFQTGMLHGLAVLDALDEMLHTLRPYETVPGATEAAYRESYAQVANALKRSNKLVFKALEDAVARFNAVPIERISRRPRVLVIGEILMNYHPSANERIVDYFESHGMEAVLPAMIDFFRRDVVRAQDGVRRNLVTNPLLTWALTGVTDWVYERILGQVDAKMRKFKFYEKRPSIHDLADRLDGEIDKSFTIGEGWAIPAEILEHASRGVDSFVIVQPFGCLPNHITGRGMMKWLKSRHPQIKIISLDYDADTSFANLENRLQMLIMAQREAARS